MLLKSEFAIQVKFRGMRLNIFSMARIVHIIALAAAFSLTCGVMMAEATPRGKAPTFISLSSGFTPYDNVNISRWAQRKISASEAKSIAKRHAPGAEVVDIARSGNTYRVRLIRKDGRVVDLKVDATTGRVRS